MTTQLQIQPTETEDELVYHWRLEQLARAGYDAHAARTLADRFDIDLHLAGDLLRRGCLPSTALRILL